MIQSALDAEQKTSMNSSSLQAERERQTDNMKEQDETGESF